MELSEYARSILLGDTLGDKLVEPEVLVDEHPLGFRVPAVPGRPQRLRWDRATVSGSDTLAHASKAPRRRFPGPSALAKAQGRGEAFHFFANHELLALELMAVALARFPNAPADFRRQIGQAMLEEQSHLRAYLAAMQDYGVDFGEIPVSAFFWNTLAGMQSPLEYVAGMCLTFEQANLDFALYYRDRFAELGDDSGAAVLQKVLDDEIGHVRIGVRWLRQFKDPRLDDFEAHAAALRAPLNLARAKGSSYFDVSVRRRAGLSAEYIERLRHAQASKGRAPTLWVFNPGFEAELLGLRAPKVEVLTADLEYCMTYLAAPDDVVALSKIPRLEFVAELEQAGFYAAEFVKIPPWPQPWSRQAFWHPKFAELRPWGPTPAAFGAMRELDAGGVRSYRQWMERENLPAPGYISGAAASADECDTGGQGPVAQEQGVSGVVQNCGEEQECSHEGSFGESVFRARRDVSDKNKALQWEREFVQTLSPKIGDKVGVQGRLISSEAEFCALREEFAASGQRWVIKDPWGTAGFGATIGDSEAFDPRQRERLRARLHRFGTLRMELWQSRRFDLSARYLAQGGKLELSALTRFLTDAGGHFVGVILSPLAKDLDSSAISFVYENGQNPHWIPKLYRQLGRFLAEKQEFRGYRGGLGVDAYVYREPQQAGEGGESGGLRLRPMVEINARYTMGHVADRLSRRIHRSSFGLWLHLSRRDLKRAGVADFEALADRLPPEVQKIGGGSKFAIARGRIWTSDPRCARQRVSILLVAESLDKALDRLGPMAAVMKQKIQNGSGDALCSS